MKRFTVLAITSLLLVLCSTLVFAPLAISKSGLVNVKILAINDFHGNLEPSNLTFEVAPNVRVPAGGVEYLSTHIHKLRAKNSNSIVVSAGDAIGASPLISAMFDDEPAIEALNAVGLDLNAVGNHEFDNGATELLRKQRGGCHPRGCRDGDGFVGAKFQFLSANVIKLATESETLFPAYVIRSFDGVKIAFIGMTLKDTPKIVNRSGVEGLDFRDEADTVNALVPKLKKQGVKAIAVLIHEGGLPTGGYNECKGISGAIVDIVKRTDPEVDLFITGHTHQAYNCAINGRLVTSASFYGRLVTDIDLILDRVTGDVETAKANNVIVTHDVPKDRILTALIEKYKPLASPLINRIIGVITSDITREANPAGESALGNLVADAQLAATADPSQGGAVVAFMNPGGLRKDLAYAQSTTKGDVTYGQVFDVQPFRDNLVTMTLTGEQIKHLLEQQFNNPRPPQHRILQVSAGFTYSYNLQNPLGERVGNIKINGTRIDPKRDYRITVNSYLANGGDNFSVLRQGRDRLTGIMDLAALEAYFQSRSPISPTPLNRITNLQ